MLNCYSSANVATAIPIYLVKQSEYASWLQSQNNEIKTWLNSVGFPANPGEFCMVPNNRNELQLVVQGILDDQDILQVGLLARGLPQGDYAFANLDENTLTFAATAWGLGAYQFDKYKTTRTLSAKLCVAECVDVKELESVVNAVYLIRDMVNTGTQDMNTQELADKVEEVAKIHGANFSKIVGDALLKANYPMIYAVGKGSISAPQLLELRWGDPQNPKVTLVGKGVCFDTGGLNLKFSDAMRYMKKDMSGAAHVLGLAQMIMQQELPINLRVLIPAVENAISGNAYHPGDVLQSRKGITVEITNTDAEGRLVLGDALTEAASESPELIIDIATLTAAARAALGTDVSAMFTDDETLAEKIMQHSVNVADPIWRLPLYKPYKKLLHSSIADLANAVLIPNAGGAITAALFLQEFVGQQTPWVHFDIMGWNLLARHVGIEGAEANVVRALFAYLKERFI